MAELDEKFDPHKVAQNAIQPEFQTHHPENHGDQDGLNDDQDTARSLEDRETTHQDETQDIGTSLQQQGDDESDILGRGFTEKRRTKKRKKKGFLSNYRARVIGGVVGTGVIGSIVTFLSLAPLKIVSFSEMIQGRASAAVQEALTTTSDNLVSSYYLNYVANSIDRGVCKSTIAPDCVVTGKATGPVGKLYASWSQAKLENKLAKDYGIIFDKKNGNLHATIGDIEITQSSLADFRAGKIDMTQLEGRNKTSRAEARQIIRNATENETLWKRSYHRYQYNRLLNKRFNVKRCTIACDSRDKFKSSLKEKRMAGKLFVAQKVGGVVGESYGLLLQCVVDTGQCETKIDSTSDGTEPKSAFQKKLDTSLSDYVAKNGAAKLSDLVDKANDVNRLGLTGYITREIGGKIAGFLGGTATKEVTEKAISKAVPYIGWASLALDIRESIPKLGTMLKSLSYATNVAGAVALFNVYQSAASEQKSGHTDMAEAGSLADTLSDESNMTAAPMYQTVAYGYQKHTAFNTLANYLSGSALAATNDSEKSGKYLCDDGKPVPKDRRVCPEEDFTNAGMAANGLYNIFENPLIKAYIGAGDVVLSPLNILNKAYKWGAGMVGAPINWAVKQTCSLVPGCTDALGWATEMGAKFVPWFINHIKPNPLLKLTGGRIMDMAVAGADAAYSKSAMINMGAAEISPQAYNSIQARRIQDETDRFARLGFVDRLLSKDNPRSLVSQVALGLPGSSTAQQSIANNFFSNPIAKVGQSVATLVPEKGSLADARAEPSPFGIPYYGYNPTDIPKDPVTYWEKNCEGRDFKKEWFSKMTDDNKDQKTGEAKPVSAEPCMLIDSAVKALGAMYGIPQDDEDATSPTPIPGTGVAFGPDGLGSGNCVDYVKHVLAKHLPSYLGGPFGDGKDFAGNLGRAMGYPVNNTPSVHSVVSFPTAYADQVHGHVAIVTAVNTDGSIVVEEFNWTVPNGYGTHTVPAQTAKNLIYAHVEGDLK
ncbi:MAG: VanY protein [Patescibacteria group bacterium]|nr:VanY protein [Patescibacteria group bacterium]